MYKRSVLSFLDILGFGKLVLSADDPEKISEMLDSLRHTEPPPDLAEKHQISFLTFSDCTVRSAFIEGENNKEFPYGLLFFELLNLVHAQINAIWDGYFIRGGVTVGNIFIEDQTIFGPALLNAYKLESEFAIHPRIVIDPQVLHLIDNDPLVKNAQHDPEDEKQHISQFVRRDSDGLCFIDYLRGAMNELDDGYAGFLQAHKDLILENAEKNKGLNAVSAKMLWAATYHNSIVATLNNEWLEEVDVSREFFEISQQELSLIADVQPNV